MITVRRAGTLDAKPMADLLNSIIQEGGTTALTEDVCKDDIVEWMNSSPDHSAWHIAEDDEAVLLGFQFIEPFKKDPQEACSIATFVRVGQTGLGIGSKLFERTAREAVQLGYSWIDATIRADNSGGLAYYQSRGFEDYARQRNVKLGNGQSVDRIQKRYELT